VSLIGVAGWFCLTDYEIAMGDLAAWLRREVYGKIDDDIGGAARRAVTKRQVSRLVLSYLGPSARTIIGNQHPLFHPLRHYAFREHLPPTPASVQHPAARTRGRQLGRMLGPTADADTKWRHAGPGSADSRATSHAGDSRTGEDEGGPRPPQGDHRLR